MQLLVRREVHGQVWYDTVEVSDDKTTLSKTFVRRKANDRKRDRPEEICEEHRD